jgi:hypothetical protein
MIFVMITRVILAVSEPLVAPECCWSIGWIGREYRKDLYPISGNIN